MLATCSSRVLTGLALLTAMSSVMAEDCQAPYVEANFNIQIPCFSTGDGAVSVELLLQTSDENMFFWDIGNITPASCEPVAAACETQLSMQADNLMLTMPQLNVFGRMHYAQWQTVLDEMHTNGGYFQHLRLNEGNAPLSLNLLHINDSHSHLIPETIDLKLAGETTRVSLGGFARVAAKIKALRASLDNTLTLHIGDAIVGTLYYSLFKGEADAAAMNALGFDAMVLGNHEFDDGNVNLQQFLNRLDVPALSANVDFSQSEALNDSQLTQPIKPYIIQQVDGQSIALVGLTTLKTLVSSSPGKDLSFADEVATAQTITAELEAQGINKIIYLTHYGYSQDQAMALQVAGIDVILGGDSHTLLGDFTAVGLSSEGNYPTIVNSPRNEPVCIAHSWQYNYVVGQLTVNFDGNGVVQSCFGQPTLVIGDDFLQADETGTRVEVSAEKHEQLAQIIAQQPNVESVTPDAEIETVLAQYVEQVDTLSQQVIGEASEDLLHIRIPGTHSSGTELPNGSIIAALVSEGFYQQLASRNYSPDMVIQNAGGVRIDVPAGEITVETAYTLLPFSNTIYLLEMTGSEVKQVLEEALTNHFDNGGSSGSFPYGYGIRYTIDMNQASGERVSAIEVLDAVSGEWQALDLAKAYRVGTNSFVAAGGDGYLAFAQVAADKRTDTFFDYAESFINYVKTVGTLSAPESTGLTFIPAN